MGAVKAIRMGNGMEDEQSVNLEIKLEMDAKSETRSKSQIYEIMLVRCFVKGLLLVSKTLIFLYKIYGFV